VIDGGGNIARHDGDPRQCTNIESVDDWPPSYAEAKSERREALGLRIRHLSVDEAEYEELIAIARDLLADPDFQRLHPAITRALHRVPRLENQDIEALARIYPIPGRRDNMLHKTASAEAVVTDQGEFTALAATWDLDRQGDRIQPGAFSNTIRRWRSSSKAIPLHWDHSGDPRDIIGTVDPLSLRETSEGLEVKGQLDLNDSEVAHEAWRSMRNDAISLSFGYMTKSSRKGSDGETILTELDLFEVSLVPHPANDQTRIISMKNAGPALDQKLLAYLIGPIFAEESKAQPPTLEELEARAKALGIDDILRKSEPIQIRTFEA
jgi:HK97 family phage prohead protease